MRDDMLPVPTALEDLEVGDEIDLPDGAAHVTVRHVGAEPIRGESGATRTVVVLDCARGLLEYGYVGERFQVVPRWVPLDGLVEAFQWDVSDPDNRDCAAAVVPALVNRLREETKRADSAETRLDESRRMRRTERDRVEEITGNRGGQ